MKTLDPERISKEVNRPLNNRPLFRFVFSRDHITSTKTLSLGCPPGAFGPGCVLTCASCLNAAYCDLANETCVCAPGYVGEFCSYRKYL